MKEKMSLMPQQQPAMSSNKKGVVHLVLHKLAKQISLQHASLEAFEAAF